MFQSPYKVPAILIGFCVGILQSVSALGATAVIGSVVGNVNATLGGAAILSNTTVFSGDSLRVLDGVAIVSTDHGGLLTFGRDTQVSFQRVSGETTVTVSAGCVTIRHPAASGPLTFKAGAVLVSPARGISTEGELAVAGTSLVVTTKDGVLRVNVNARTAEVGRGQSLAWNTWASQTKGGPELSSPVEGIESTGTLTRGFAIGPEVGVSASDRASSSTATASSGLQTTRVALDAAISAHSSGCGRVPSPSAPPRHGCK